MTVGKDFSAINASVSLPGVMLMGLVKKNEVDRLRDIISKSNGVNLNIRVSGETPLIEAINNGHTDMVRLLLDNNADANYKNGRGDLPLELAIKRNNTNMSNWLIDKGADVKANGKSYLELALEKNNMSVAGNLIRHGISATPYLYQAIRDNNTNRANWLIDNGADVNSKANDKSYLQLALEKNNMSIAGNLIRHGANATPYLYQAIRDNNTNRANWLIDNGADVNSKANDKSYLQLALEKNNMSIAGNLIRHGANATPCLYVAIRDNDTNRANWLIDNGADVNSKANGKPYLELALEKNNMSVAGNLIRHGANATPYLYQAIRDNNTSRANWLIENGVDVNASANGKPYLVLALEKNNTNIANNLVKHGAKTTPCLYIAIKDNDTNMANWLIENGADVNASANGKPYLVLALEKNNKSIASKLVRYGANTTSCLYMAIKDNDTDMLNWLIDNGADVNASVNGKPYLVLALEKNNKSIASKLVRNGANTTESLCFTLKRNNAGIANWLINNGANVNAMIDGKPLLVYALKNNNADIVNSLIDNRANVNVIVNGTNPLILALERNDNNIVRNLIDHGANRTVSLKLAIEKNDCNISKWLINNGANVNATIDGTTILIVAIRKDNLDIVNQLIIYGADVNKPDNEGVTPIEKAVQRGNTKIVETLIGKGALINDKQDEFLMMSIGNSNLDLVKLFVNKFKADINKQDGLGNTPIEEAVKRNSTKIAEFLVTRTKRPLDINGKQNKFLMMAIENCNLDLVKIFVDEYKADVNLQHDGNTPIGLARKKKSFKVKYFLIKRGAECKSYEKRIYKLLELNKTLKHKTYKILKAPVDLAIKFAKMVKKYVFGIKDKEINKDKTKKISKSK